MGIENLVNKGMNRRVFSKSLGAVAATALTGCNEPETIKEDGSFKPDPRKGKEYQFHYEYENRDGGKGYLRISDGNVVLREFGFVLIDQFFGNNTAKEVTGIKVYNKAGVSEYQLDWKTNTNHEPPDARLVKYTGPDKKEYGPGSRSMINCEFTPAIQDSLRQYVGEFYKTINCIASQKKIEISPLGVNCADPGQCITK